MLATINGRVERIDSYEIDNKVYPYFELFQLGNDAVDSSVIRVSGNGVKVGDQVSFACEIKTNDKGKIKFKKLDVKPDVNKK